MKSPEGSSRPSLAPAGSADARRLVGRYVAEYRRSLARYRDIKPGEESDRWLNAPEVDSSLSHRA